MSDTTMSVSEREAEQQYPTQYWEGTKIKRSFDMTTDDLQDAYMRGREAEPCKEQVRAAAKALSAHMDEWDINHGFDREVDNSTVRWITVSIAVAGRVDTPTRDCGHIWLACV